jgi:hypothetical protein
VLTWLAAACASKPAAAPPPAALADATASGTASADDAGSDDSSEEPSSDPAEAPRGEVAAEAGPCPADMVLVETTSPSPRRFCVDTYEASLVEILPDGTERPFAHYMPVDGHDVRAVSKASTLPQGFISEVQAQDACSASGKRLCSLDEWKTACMGPARTTFPYGASRRSGACHDTGKSAVLAVFGAKAVAASTPFVAPPASTPTSRGKRAHVTKGRAAQSSRPRVAANKVARPSKPAPPKKERASRRTTGKKSARPANVDPGVWARLNDPALGQVEGALAKTGEHAECVNGFGAFDMVGNIHEWVATDPAAAHGTFAGGYYLDTAINGDGCNYKTQAHAHDYHDYSTGFRCCSEASTTRP